jgi:lactoylglutathione lyase
MSFTYDHMHLFTPDVPRAVEFYKSNLDAEIVDLTRPPGGATIKIGGTKVLVQNPQDGQGLDDKVDFKAVRSFDHFAFTVPDIEAAAKRLKGNGVVFLVEPKEIRPGVKLAFIQAPDNVKIELIQRG